MSNRSSARRLQLDQSFDQAMSLPDRQATAFSDHEVADESFAREFEKHFAGMDVLKDEVKIKAATRLRNSIKRGVEKQMDSVIEMGRALIEAEKAFSRPEWKHLLAGGNRLLGLPKNTASMYRAIARDIDGGRIERSNCPDSYSTVYFLTTFEEWQLNAAKTVGLINPNVTRKEVADFKRLPPSAVQEATDRIKQPATVAVAAPNRDVLQEQERRLTLRERKLLDDLGRTQTELERVREALKMSPERAAEPVSEASEN